MQRYVIRLIKRKCLWKTFLSILLAPQPDNVTTFVFELTPVGYILIGVIICLFIALIILGIVKAVKDNKSKKDDDNDIIWKILS